jgi:hypothetical protein
VTRAGGSRWLYRKILQHDPARRQLCDEAQDPIFWFGLPCSGLSDFPVARELAEYPECAEFALWFCSRCLAIYSDSR